MLLLCKHLLAAAGLVHRKDDFPSQVKTISTDEPFLGAYPLASIEASRRKA
jgi:hypothetical protein